MPLRPKPCRLVDFRRPSPPVTPASSCHRGDPMRAASRSLTCEERRGRTFDRCADASCTALRKVREGEDGWTGPTPVRPYGDGRARRRCQALAEKHRLRPDGAMGLPRRRGAWRSSSQRLPLTCCRGRQEARAAKGLTSLLLDLPSPRRRGRPSSPRQSAKPLERSTAVQYLTPTVVSVVAERRCPFRSSTTTFIVSGVPGSRSPAS